MNTYKVINPKTKDEFIVEATDCTFCENYIIFQNKTYLLNKGFSKWMFGELNGVDTIEFVSKFPETFIVIKQKP